MKQLELLFTPADFEAFGRRDVSDAVCVVFDVLRATSSMVTALANGARTVRPVPDIPEALDWRTRLPDVLLAGERDGFRITSALTGGIDFDLGNSPREFTADRVANRDIIMTTTNGTRALHACAKARSVLVGSFLNLGATAARLRRMNPDRLLVVCSGTHEEAAYEDALGGGALCDEIWEIYNGGQVADSALMARQLYLAARTDLIGAIGLARNGRRLLGLPLLAEDVPLCLRRDSLSLVAELCADGAVRTVA